MATEEYERWSAVWLAMKARRLFTGSCMGFFWRLITAGF